MDKKLILYASIFIGVLLIGVGLYVVLSPKDNPDSNTAVVIDSTPSSNLPTSSSSKGSLMVDQQWQYIGKFSGKILIEMSGKVTLDPNRPAITPDGINEVAPQGFTVPGISQYCSLVKVNSEIQKVGSKRELVVNGDLYLGVN